MSTFELKLMPGERVVINKMTYQFIYGFMKKYFEHSRDRPQGYTTVIEQELHEEMEKMANTLGLYFDT